MFNAIIDSVKSGGINVIDTGIHFRKMKSLRALNASLKYLIKNDFAKREELFICSNIGNITDDRVKDKNGIDFVNKL